MDANTISAIAEVVEALPGPVHHLRDPVPGPGADRRPRHQPRFHLRRRNLPFGEDASTSRNRRQVHHVTFGDVGSVIAGSLTRSPRN